MRIVALEEHFVTPEVLAAWDATPPRWQDRAIGSAHGGAIGARLADLGDGRIAAMDEGGIDVQVLSLTAPALHSLEAEEAAALQVACNDHVADAIGRHADRLQGFATLATAAPDLAARELERCVRHLGFNGAMLFGRTRDRNLDDRRNWPIFEAAAALRAPIYLHPQAPLPAVQEAIYSGLGDDIDGALATFGIGWHYEIGIQIVRLVLAGVFDRFPDLQIITGHWGEVVLFYLDRLDGLKRVTSLERPVSDYFRRNVSVTPSGLWSERYIRWAIEVLGVERILFSADYPYRYAPGGEARRYLLDAAIDEESKRAIAHGNWDRLVAAIRR